MVGDRYNIKTISTFSKGRDGGRDAVANDVNIDLGGGNILTNQKLVVQAKHTEKESEIIDKKVYKSEKIEVEKLIQKRQLDIYVLVTNYKIPAGQSDKIVEYFEGAGAKNVVPVGKETLSQWLNDSPKLKNKVICQHPDLIDPKAEQSIQLLNQYREDLKKIIDVEAFRKAKEIVESDKGLVFITGDQGTGKTTVAKQLVVHLSDKYNFFHIINKNDFAKNWDTNQKHVFFMDNIDSDCMKEWRESEDAIEILIAEGSKFVFAGKTEVLGEPCCSLNKFHDRLCNAVINLSDPKFNLSKEKKQEMLKKHIEIGNNDNLIKEALLEVNTLSHAAEINCRCFPYVAKLLGRLPDSLKEFNVPVPTVYNKKFLNHFFDSVQTKLDQKSRSKPSMSSTSKRPRPKPPTTGSSADNEDNITGSIFESCESPTPNCPRSQPDDNGDGLKGQLTNSNFNCLKPVIFQ